MRALAFVVALACFVGFLAPPAIAQDAEALKKEIEQLRKQLESVTERLRRLEAQPAPVTPPPAPSPAGPPAMAPPPPGMSLAELARPRPPFSLYAQRGAGQLLFDIGVTVELSLFGQVDPYAYAEVRIETGEEARGQELGVKLAEASVTLLTLPLGTQAKFGQMRNRFGYSNMIHEHDLPWIDRPNVLRNFLGGEGLQEKGVEVTIVPDLPFYLEGLAGVFNGDNETAFGRGTLRIPLFTGRLRTFLELGDENAVQLGMSVASGETTEKQRDTLLGWEGRYKYRPEGWLHPLVTVTGEAIYSFRRVLVEVDTDGDGLTDLIRKRERDRFGWYAGAEVQPFRRWAAGVRYDWSEFPATPGKERSVEPYITFWPSEFLRFRLAYKNTDRTHRETPDLNDGSAKRVDEILFQGTFILGAHPAHPF